MRITFLGTGAALPSRTRNVSGLALSFEQRGGWWLFDCGEGTQHQLIDSALSPARLERVFISHLHGDHCFGLPGMLCSREMHGATSPLTVHGPPGIAAYIQAIERTTLTHFGYPLTVEDLAPPARVDGEDGCVVHAVEVVHARTTLGWVVVEPPSPGRLRADELARAGVPSGPLFAAMKRGETVTLPDGRTLDGTQFLDPARPGRTVAIVFDSCDSSAIVPWAGGADLLVHEATYLGRTQAELATRNLHSTAAQAGALARQIGARRLALHHISPRYDSGHPGEPGPADLAAEAHATFGGDVICAHDGLVIDVPRRRA